MNRRNFKAIGILPLLFIGINALQAFETVDGVPFFDRGTEQYVKHDKNSNTWTFGNNRIEAKLRCDQNGFKVTSFRDKKNNLDIATKPSSAGQFELNHSKVVVEKTNVPANYKKNAQWVSHKIGQKARRITVYFQDRIYLYELQVISGGNNIAVNKSFVCSGPYSTYGKMEYAIDGKSLKADKGSFWDSRFGLQSYEVDLGSVQQIDEIKFQGSGDCKWYEIAVSDFTTVDLAKDFSAGKWVLEDNKGIKGGGVKTLKIEAIGKNGNKGIKATICYDLFPGDEPWTTKWFDSIALPETLKQADKDVLELRTVQFDEFQTGNTLTANQTQSRKQWYKRTSLHLVPKNNQGTNGFFTSNLNYNPFIEVGPGKIRVAYQPFVSAKRYLGTTGNKTTKAMAGFWEGGSYDSGKFQYQIFLIDRHIMTGPSTTRPTLNVWPAPDASKVDGAMKTAKAMGVFAMDEMLRFKTQFAQNIMLADVNDPKTFQYKLNQHGLRSYLSTWEGSIPKNMGIYPSNISDARRLGIYFGKLSANAKAIQWFIEDGSEDGQFFLPHHGAMWREGIRIMHEEMKKAVAPETMSICRSWVKCIDVMDIQDTTADTDLDNYGWADGWVKFYLSWAPLRPNFTHVIWQPFCGINHTRCKVRDGKKARDLSDYEFATSRSATMGAMWPITGGMPFTAITPEEIRMHKKWADWHWANRFWMEYTQKIDFDNVTEGAWVYGLMHLRNEYKNKYGFVCWWNESKNAGKVAVRIDQTKWNLNIDPNTLEIKSVRTGKTIPFTAKGKTIHISPQPIANWSFEILELIKK